MERRKRLIVDSSSQARMVRRIALLPLAVLCLAAVAMAYMSSRVIDEATRSSVELPSLAALLMTMLTFLLAAGALTTVQALRYSHTVAGPTYRLQQSIRRIREGDLDFRITLRRDDELTAIADELNALIETLGAQRGVDTPALQEVSVGAPDA